jgi:hypothetical protein
MRFAILIISFIFLSQPSYAKWGKGPLKLNKESMEVAIMYMYGAGNVNRSFAGKRKNDPMMLAFSEDGTSYMYYYCPVQYQNQCDDSGIARSTIVACEKYSNGSPCFVFAKKRRIVWKNGGPKTSIKKKYLKSPYKVAKMIQDAGFYDGDITKLAGVDVNSGQVDDTIKITGEDKTNTNTSKSNDSTDIVKELETLSNLYKSGTLTKTEFEKAKKKLLKN